MNELNSLECVLDGTHLVEAAAGTGKNYADSGGGNINAFIENLTGDENGVFTVAEAVKKGFAFCTFGVVGYHRKREVSADGVGTVVVGSENQNAFTGVLLKNGV